MNRNYARGNIGIQMKHIVSEAGSCNRRDIFLYLSAKQTIGGGQIQEYVPTVVFRCLMKTTLAFITMLLLPACASAALPADGDSKHTSSASIGARSTRSTPRSPSAPTPTASLTPVPTPSSATTPTRPRTLKSTAAAPSSTASATSFSTSTVRSTAVPLSPV